ncbi:hypothetical protein RYX36_020454 [Vicia faba]
MGKEKAQVNIVVVGHVDSDEKPTSNEETSKICLMNIDDAVSISIITIFHLFHNLQFTPFHSPFFADRASETTNLDSISNLFIHGNNFVTSLMLRRKRETESSTTDASAENEPFHQQSQNGVVVVEGHVQVFQ